MTLESKAAFARRLGVNKSTITRAAQAGRLVLNGDMVDVEASLARWHATQAGRTDVAERHAAQRGHAVGGLPAYAPAPGNATAARFAPSVGQVAGELPAQPLPQPEAPGADGGGDRTRYKALVLQYENQTLKLAMALRQHLRYPLDDVRRESLGLGASLRASIERLIDQTAPRLAAEPNESARTALLRAEVAALARAMRVEFVRALRRLRQPGAGNQP